jgi:phage terminase small subunit
MHKINAKQQKFCEEYVVDYNGTQAAIRAGYAPRSAEVKASKLLRIDKVRSYIDQLKLKQQERTDITADRVLNEIAKLAFYNSQDFTDQQGRLKSIQDMPRGLTSAITSIKQKTFGEGGEILETEYKVADKLKAAELLGKHLKLFSDRIVHEAGEGIAFNMNFSCKNDRD